MNISGWVYPGFNVLVNGKIYWLNSKKITKAELEEAISKHFSVKFNFTSENPDAAAVVSAMYEAARAALKNEL